MGVFFNIGPFGALVGVGIGVWLVLKFGLAAQGASPAGLMQASGEIATGSQQTTFDAMGLFMDLLIDPFMDRSGNGARRRGRDAVRR